MAIDRKVLITLIVFISIAVPACTTTVGGALFVFGLRDIILYIFLALIVAVIASLVSKKGNRHQMFWIWFIVSLLLTPLAGLIYIIVRLMKRVKDDEIRRP
jgi:hypothetical protein